MPINYNLPGYSENAKNTIRQFLNGFFSQYAEDVVLGALLNRGDLPQVGFYVDLGAYHPLQYSNTMMLHMLGWNGINMDANPDVIELFKQARPHDTNICAGISDQNTILNYHRFKLRGCNTFSAEQAAKIIAKGHQRLSIEKIKCYDINELLARSMPKQQHIDVLNIDLEGLDEKVLKKLDWQQYSPTVLLTEAFQENIEEYVHSDIHIFIRNKGYTLISKSGHTAVYQKNTS